MAIRLANDPLDAVYSGEARRLDLITLDETEGLPSGEMMNTANGAFRDSTGRFWLATSRGAVVVDPMTIEPSIPSIKIHSLKLNEAIHRPSDRLRFRPGPSNTVSIAFSSQTLLPERNVRYRSRLLGFENQWRIDALQERHFTNLKPGSYTFEVIAIDHNRKRSAAPAKVTFTLLPVWYQSWWIRTFAVVCIVLGAWRVHQRRERHQQLLYESVRLRDRLSERARLSRDTHDDVLNNLVIRKMQLDHLLSLENLTEDGKQLVEGEIQAIEDLIDAQQERVWEVDPKWDRIDALADRMTRWLRTLPAGLCLNVTVWPEEGFPNYAIPGDVRHHIYTLFQEAVGNAIKHADCSSIDVCLRYDQGVLRFVVRDDGNGFDPASAAEEGNGLKNMKDRAREAGGTLTIDSHLGDGTSITFAINVRDVERASH